MKGDYLYIDIAKCTLTNNTFLPSSYTVSESDFESTDFAQLASDRKADGSLPDINFMKLKPTSQFYSLKIGYQFKYGDVTGINSIESEKSSHHSVYDNKYYNIMGVNVKNPVKGLFIYNGKKIIK